MVTAVSEISHMVREGNILRFAFEGVGEWHACAVDDDATWEQFQSWCDSNVQHLAVAIDPEQDEDWHEERFSQVILGERIG